MLHDDGREVRSEYLEFTRTEGSDEVWSSLTAALRSVDQMNSPFLKDLWQKHGDQ